MKCECRYEDWTAQPFGGSWVALCGRCGANVTERAERELGITDRHDTIDMAREHLALIRYERAS
jgi:hypothetical protein